MGGETQLSGPDLKEGIAEGELRDGVPLLGHADGEAVVLVKVGERVHAVGATCSHYGGPLAEGIVADGAIHCPWHHACFDLATGTAGGPALSSIPCWNVRHEGGRVRIGSKRTTTLPLVGGPKAIAIVGGGAAGVACAEALRLEGYAGTIRMIVAEGSDPVDRPNLSKDFLAGTAPEEWVTLRSREALGALEIEVIDGPALAIDLAARQVRVADRSIGWDALLYATGAEPIRLPIEGATLPHVHTLRTLADSKAIAAASSGARAVVIGASFIGLEAAASLRARGAAVTVVAPEAVPLARVLGDEVGAFVRRVHEGKDVAFRLGRKPVRISADAVELDDGTRVPADLVVMGVGVRPRLALAEAAGMHVDRGVMVDAALRASDGVYAAGDVARYPWDGEQVRIEHWQVAVRHGQAVARAILGGTSPRRDVPFFWSAHYDVTINYVGHAEAFDPPEVHGDLDARDAHVVYRSEGRVRAVASVGRDRLSLEVEAAMAHGDQAALNAIVARA